jgi:AAA domain
VSDAFDRGLAALLEADPGALPSPVPDPGEMGIDEASLNGAGPTAPPTAPDEIAIVTAPEFAAVEEPGADPLLGEAGEAVIPEGGDVMLYGDGGASKTTLSIDLACHLAAGDPWLGIPIPKPARVLLIEAEGPRPLFRQKIRAKLERWHGSDLGGRLLVWERPWADFSFPNAEGVAPEIARQEVDVLLVGPLTRVGMDELGTLQQVRDFTSHVERLRAQTGRRLTVFLVHHENKGGSVSGAWEGAGDTLLHAKVHAPGKTTLEFQKARWASAWHKRTLELGWTAGEGFEVVDEDERDYADEIEDFLRGTDKWMTVEEIRQPREKGGIGANRSEVNDALEAHPERFTSRTGDDAKAVGRSPRATVWQLVQAPERVERVGPSQGDTGTHSLTRSPLRESERDERVPHEQPELDREAERVGTGCPSHPQPTDGCRYCRTQEGT